MLPNACALLARREKILTELAERSSEEHFALTPSASSMTSAKRCRRMASVTLDGGMYKIWFARDFRTSVANTVLPDNALTTMGAGLPSAIAAALIRLRRKILACGDGGFMMNSQDMETAVRLGVHAWC